MKFLFLDTETSALSPTKGQVIEMAGVLAELDPTTLKLRTLDHFEELVRFRSAELDERVTRITGITEEDLEQAAPLVQVQGRWADWLERWSHEKVYVVGHSVEFDLAFIRAESWFLPGDHVALDTLALVKVLLPDSSAINLEYLVNKYALSPDLSQTESFTELAAHRALYDTLCCLHLFEFCLQRVRALQACPEFYEVFLEYFQLEELTFYGRGVESDKAITPLNLQRLNFDGTLAHPNIFQKINQLGTKQIETGITHLLSLSLPPSLRLSVLQLYVLNLLASEGHTELKFHARSQLEYTFIELLLDQVLSLDTERPETVYLERFETLTLKVRALSEKQFPLTRLVTLLEIYTLLVPTTTTIQQVVSAYDFFLITLQPFWVRSEFVYKPFDLKPQEAVIRAKIGALNLQLQTLYRQTWTTSTPLLESLVEEIKALLDTLRDGERQLFIRTNNNLQFRFARHQLFVAQKHDDWRLNAHLEQLLSEWRPVISTDLSRSDFAKYLELTGTKRVLDTYEPIHFPEQDPELILSPEAPKLAKFFLDNITLAKQANQPVLVLCGQNSGLRDAEKVLPGGDFDKGDYLILGDTGSLTKIGSKLQQGFRGIVLVKTGDFAYFARLGLLEWAKIWILSAPYFPVDNYWWKLARASGRRDEWLRLFKYMHLKAVAAHVGGRTKSPVHFQKSYDL